MTWPRSKTLLSAPFVAALGTALVVLAVLQYRWIDELTRAQRVRLERDLNRSTNQFRAEFSRNLLRLGRFFQLDMPEIAARDWDGYARRKAAWEQSEEDYFALANIYLWPLDQGPDAPLLKLDPASGAFEPVDRPSRFEALGPLALRSRVRPGAGGLRPFSWSVLTDPPALVQLLAVPARGFGGARGGRAHGVALVILELDWRFFTESVFPELTRRYFGGPDGLVYQVAILAEGEGRRLVYSSDPDLSESDWERADTRPPLLSARDLRERGFPPRNSGQGPPPGSVGAAGGPRIRGGRRQIPTILTPAGFGGRWRLLVKHREGSLLAAAESFRNRNLAISLGVLALLGASLGMILVSTRRAQRLAAMQMDFVAGVSHELRTPLAVIRSAADNLAEGVVVEGDQVREYGRLIRSEGRRLSGMVRQTLTFAAGQSGKRSYALEPVEVAAVIEEALLEASPDIAEADFTVDKQIDPDLPKARADAAALTSCVLNLIQNAIKYGGEKRWAAIRATASDGQIEIRVEDRGMGVERSEAPHLFEPFFRGKRAAAQQIPGAGLGLSLTRDAVEAMGGRISVESAPGEGAAFTLRLSVDDGTRDEIENPAG